MQVLPSYCAHSEVGTGMALACIVPRCQTPSECGKKARRSLLLGSVIPTHSPALGNSGDSAVWCYTYAYFVLRFFFYLIAGLDMDWPAITRATA